MRRRFLLVCNRSAGRGGLDRVNAVVGELEGRGCHVAWLSDDHQDTLDDSEALKSYDAVIAAGGDGTIRRLIATEAGQAVPLGLIPNGTGNVLAHEIGLRQSPGLIADVLIAGPQHVVSSGRFGSSVFLLMLGFGFDGQIIHRLNMSLKGQIGKAAYVGAVLATLAEHQPTFQLTVDGKQHSATWAVVANARRYGGGFMLAPGAGITKRSFQVVLFQPSTRLVRIQQLWALANGHMHTSPMTKTIAGSDIRFEGGAQSIKAQADGDPLDVCPTHITAGRTLHLIVPNRFLR